MRELTIEVPDSVYDYCEATVKETEFASVQEYVRFILEEVCTANSSDGSSAVEDGSRDIEDQLESLGYK